MIRSGFGHSVPTNDKIETYINPERLIEFWDFVCERQEIYHKRFVLKQPYPWTNDPILRGAFFTNVYRELDPGTIYLKEQVLDHGASPEDELFEILVYRHFNRMTTYAESLKYRKYGEFNKWEHVAYELSIYGRKTGTKLFTDAHMTTGIKWGGFPDKIRNSCWLMNQHYLHKEEIYRDVMSAGSLEDQSQVVSMLDGYGPFVAYEVVTDLGYSKQLRKFSEDDWANPGPGCRGAIDTLIPNRRAAGIKYLNVIKYLRDNQRFFVDGNDIRFGDKFKFLDGKDLSLRNVEHSLCEYYKYYRAKHEGYIRRRYKFNGA